VSSKRCDYAEIEDFRIKPIIMFGKQVTMILVAELLSGEKVEISLGGLK